MLEAVPRHPTAEQLFAGVYFLQAQIDVRMPGVAHEMAEAIAHAAHAMCPYSKAVHGNIDVVANVDVALALAA
ncbi:hypothetical protein [Pelomonas sp. KK5]|uniref:hypothetical protein n=1 Tax=Pelomonas sp. KK5 TaxID=1855730 RepID=UPI0018E94C68|nr:hypothetical protein [Pelomonas sp. KK5]